MMSDQILYIGIPAIAATVIFLLRTIFASKCAHVRFGWGCIDIDREVRLEVRDIGHPSPSKYPLEIITDESKV